MAANPTLDISDDPSPDDVDIVRDGLNAYNAGFAPNDDHRSLAVFVRDATGCPVGGLIGGTCWEWLPIDLLWGGDEPRGAGWGSRLLAAGENEARPRLPGGRPEHAEFPSPERLPGARLRRHLRNP